jgi:hypothetical protein
LNNKMIDKGNNVIKKNVKEDNEDLFLEKDDQKEGLDKNKDHIDILLTKKDDIYKLYLDKLPNSILKIKKSGKFKSDFDELENLFLIWNPSNQRKILLKKSLGSVFDDVLKSKL